MTRILCFGDSISFGSADSGGGWPQRLHNDLAKIYINKTNSPIHRVMNLSVPGDTVSAIHHRIKSESKSRHIDDSGVIILATGANDSLYYRDTSEFKTDIDDFAAQIKKLIQAALSLTKNCIVVGLFPCDEDKTQPVAWATKSESYSNQRLKMFNIEMKSVCEELDVVFIDMLDDALKLKYSKYLHDGLHPNSIGHQYIADRMNTEVARLANNYEQNESGK